MSAQALGPGSVVGRLRVLTAPFTYNGYQVVRALCSCGRESQPSVKNLLRGKSRSCGCARGDSNRARAKHSHASRGSHTPAYKGWRYMRDRLANDPDYADVYLDPRWDDFTAFYREVGDPPSPSHTLDRIDNAKGYEPGNVRWATVRQQQNNKTTNVVVQCHGLSLTISEWAGYLNIPYKVLHRRLREAKWPVAKALTTPVKRLGEFRKGNPEKFDLGGQLRTIEELVEISGFSKSAIRHRLKRGWSAQEAITRPLRLTAATRAEACA